MNPSNDNATRPTSFDAQLTKLLPRVRNYATRYQHHDADDLAQAAAVKALANWRSYTPGTSMMPWLVGHVMNAARVVAPPANDLAGVHATTQPAQEHATEIQQVLALLEPQEREAMAIVATGGFATDISATLGVTHKAARHIVERARARIVRAAKRADVRCALAWTA